MDYMSHTIRSFGVLGVCDTSACWEAQELVLDLHAAPPTPYATQVVEQVANGLTDVAFAEARPGGHVRVIVVGMTFDTISEFAECVDQFVDQLAEAIEVHTTRPLIDESFPDDPTRLRWPFAKAYPARRG